MAHPFNHHRVHKVEKRRVGGHLSAYDHHGRQAFAHGGAVHDDAAEDAKQIRKMVKPAALRMHGGNAKHRADKRARGGRTKHKGAKTVVNVIAGHHPATPPMVPPMAPPAAPPMAAAPPAPRPMVPPPGAGAPGLPGAGPPMMRKHGGSVNAKSGPGWTESMDNRKPFVSKSQTNKDDGKDIGRGKPITYKKGGAVKRDSGGAVHESQHQSQVAEGMKGRKAGGRIEAPKKTFAAKNEAPKAAKAITPHLPGGSGGGLGRLKKAHSPAFHG